MRKEYGDNDYDYEPEERTPREGQLAVDVHQDGDYIVVKSTIAGVNRRDINISIAADRVTIRGIRNPERRVHPDDYYHQELHWGAFSRSIILPTDIDVSGTRASMKDGILTIRLPKRGTRQNRRIRNPD